MPDNLDTVVEAALTETGDFDHAWEQLCTAIEATPSDPALRRLRLRMADAAYLRLQQVEDLRALCALEPEQRDWVLQCSLAEHRWSWQLAQAALAQDADEETEASEADEDAIQAAHEHIQETALGRLAALAERHARDAGFIEALLSQWDEHLGRQPPWLRLRLSLLAGAANPDNVWLRRDLALQWASLSEWAPAVQLPEGAQPMGFAVDVYGGLHDALLTQRALIALDGLMGDASDDAELLETRARLNLGVSRFDRAAAGFNAAADAWERQLARGEDPDDTIRGRAEQARDLADQCAAGRARLSSTWMAEMQRATARLGEGLVERPGASEAARAFLSEARDSHLRAQAELQAVLDTHGPLVAAAAAPPTAEELAAMDTIARQAGQAVAGSLSFVPTRWQAVDAGDDGTEPDARLLAAAPGFAEAGLESLGYLEHLDFSERLGAPAVCRIWADAPGHCVLSHATAGTIEVVDIATVFDDASQVTTSLTRGRNFLGAPPQLDALNLDADLSWGDAIALHRARVAARMANSPALHIEPVRDLGAFMDMEEAQRKAKLAWRLRDGLSEFEALGVPADKPEYLVPRMRDAVRSSIQQFRQAYAAGLSGES